MQDALAAEDAVASVSIRFSSTASEQELSFSSLDAPRAAFVNTLAAVLSSGVGDCKPLLGALGRAAEFRRADLEVQATEQRARELQAQLAATRAAAEEAAARRRSLLAAAGGGGGGGGGDGDGGDGEDGGDGDGGHDTEWLPASFAPA